MILINIWALLRCLYTLILEFLLHYLFCNLLYQSLFFFLQIVPTLQMGEVGTVSHFKTFFLDFSFGKRHMSVGRLKCSRLGQTTLSWEQNESLKKRERECISFSGCFLTLLTYSFIENAISGSTLSLWKEKVTLLSEAVSHCSQSRCFL